MAVLKYLADYSIPLFSHVHGPCRQIDIVNDIACWLTSSDLIPTSFQRLKQWKPINRHERLAVENIQLFMLPQL